MQQPQREHLDYLDGWRGIAIACLLAGHFVGVPGLDLGDIGVNLFFVLSGWLMARLLFVYETPIPEFYRRRISRIFPAHYLFIAVIVAYFLLREQPVRWYEVGTAALFISNYASGELGQQMAMPLRHIWSLCVEEHCYLLLSVVAIAARRGWIDALRALGLIALASAAIQIFYAIRYGYAELKYDLWWQTEVSGFGIFASAFLMLWLQRRPVKALPWWLCPALGLCGVAAYWWWMPLPVRTIVGTGLFALAVNLLAASPGWLKRVLASLPLRMLGLWSFSIYLWQQPFYVAVADKQMPAWLGLSLALAAGITSFYLVEKPARAALNRVWTQARIENKPVVAS